MPYLAICVALLFRLAPHPWNVTPLGAMFLFSGAMVKNKPASLLVPLAALVVSDAAVDMLLYGGRYSWFSPFTWGAFLAVAMIGWLLRPNAGALRVAGASLAGSATFFLISNFGVWAQGHYTPDLQGLVECYVAAIPFLRNTLLGDLGYAALLFGGSHLYTRYMPRPVQVAA
ncbi:MAG TPA: DUF6580 family putative transport protein [Beijerinckiaceae bacterium]|jgi:hypothetical protein